MAQERKPAKRPPAKETPQKTTPKKDKVPFTKQMSTKEGRSAFFKKALNIIGILFCVGVICGSILAVVIVSYLVKVTANDDRTLNLNEIKLSYTTILYAQEEESGEWVEYQRLGSQEGGENRVWVDLGDMNEYLPLAFIAVEDKTFYDHGGVNWYRSFAALANDILMKLNLPSLFSSRQGASTITQQLIKNLTGDEQQDGMRKLREMYRAMVLEKQYSKDFILEAYLNVLRLTGQIAGVQSGAYNYFGVDVKDLTIAQCASIAAITKNPYAYNPYTFPEDHIERRDYVLWCMFDQGIITEEQYNDALAEELNLQETTITNTGSRNTWFTDTVIEEVITDLVAQHGYTRAEATTLLYNGGLRIYTTLVPSLQNAMEEVMTEATMFADRTHTYTATVNGASVEIEEEAQACMVSLTYNGGIAAIVGGIGEKEVDRGLNRALVPRQTGSSMKPIAAYVLGIEYQYITMSSAIMDSPLKQIRDEQTGILKDWPQNYSRTYEEKEVLVSAAIARSLNTIAVKVGQMVGVGTMYDFLEGTLGITSLVPSGAQNDKDLAPLVLGALTQGISPLEMAGAYMMFGNGGVHYTPHSYTTVENAQGDVILEKNVTRIQAISEETAAIMLRMLTAVLQPGGTGGGLATNNMASAGKTGTTSDNKDHWFVGLTPYYVTATWWGFDHPDVLTKFTYATHPPTTAWRAVMNAAQKDLPWKAFPVCKTLTELTICAESGDLANGACPETRTGYYKQDRVPGSCTLHG